MAKETITFNSGADRASLKTGLEERFANGSLMLSGGGAANGLTFAAQRDQGTNFFSYGGTRGGSSGDEFQGGTLDDTVREGDTTGAYGKGEPIRNRIPSYTPHKVGKHKIPALVHQTNTIHPETLKRSRNVGYTNISFKTRK